VCFEVLPESVDWSVPDERIESGREFQILGAAAQNELEPKIKLVRGRVRD